MDDDGHSSAQPFQSFVEVDRSLLCQRPLPGPCHVLQNHLPEHRWHHRPLVGQMSFPHTFQVQSLFPRSFLPPSISCRGPPSESSLPNRHNGSLSSNQIGVTPTSGSTLLTPWPGTSTPKSVADSTFLRAPVPGTETPPNIRS